MEGFSAFKDINVYNLVSWATQVMAFAVIFALYPYVWHILCS